MSAAKIIITLAIIGVCCISFATSIKCFTCTTSKDCKKPSKLECNQTLANQTRDYLKLYYTGVPNVTSNSFECMRDWLKTPTNEMMHKGCIFSNFQSCGYTVNSYFAAAHDRSCKQCNTEGCNPADRAIGSLKVVVYAIIVTALAKCGAWRN
ncbi:uncharacterized protein LOC118734525 [Rhagoletis pomonella]|uniref:uncharacterized protein LOC118734525 n=1 Tax=Rhagoletis pomonella TaxID=28610 RepID=UPI0017809E64|nr:uncharacterized protein LOC118734525 [Rhagoletis pomonella]